MIRSKVCGRSRFIQQKPTGSLAWFVVAVTPAGGKIGKPVGRTVSTQSRMALIDVGQPSKACLTGAGRMTASGLLPLVVDSGASSLTAVSARSTRSATPSGGGSRNDVTS